MIDPEDLLRSGPTPIPLSSDALYRTVLGWTPMNPASWPIAKETRVRSAVLHQTNFSPFSRRGQAHWCDALVSWNVSSKVWR